MKKVLFGFLLLLMFNSFSAQTMAAPSFEGRYADSVSLSGEVTNSNIMLIKQVGNNKYHAELWAFRVGHVGDLDGNVKNGKLILSNSYGEKVQVSKKGNGINAKILNGNNSYLINRTFELKKMSKKTDLYALFSSKVNYSSWKLAYASIIEKYDDVENYFSSSYFSYLKYYFHMDVLKFNKYFLYDVDKNKIPELFLAIPNTGMYVVLTFKNKQLQGLDYIDLYGINKKKHILVVKGHWHGAGGSGANEWSTYKISSQGLSCTNYIDKYGSNVTIFANGKTVTANKLARYNKVYNSQIKGTTNVSKFKKYQMGSTSGIKA